MVKRHVELAPEGLEIRYLSPADLKLGMPVQQKFGHTGERRAWLKKLLGENVLQHIGVFRQGHPVALLSLQGCRHHANIVVFQETMPGIINNEMFGRIADFLAVDWVVKQFRSDDEIFNAWGERDGHRLYLADAAHPSFRRPLPLDKNGVHAKTGLKFVFHTRPLRDVMELEQRQSVLELNCEGIRDEAKYDQLHICMRELLSECGGELENAVKKIFRDARYNTALVYDTEGMKLVGSMFIHNPDPFDGKQRDIAGMVIAKEYRGLGYAGLLLDFAMAQLDERVRELTAAALTSNHASRKLFEDHPAFNFVLRDRAQSRLINGYYRRSGTKNELSFHSELLPV